MNRNPFRSKPLSCFLTQAAFGTAFSYLTSGVFLSGLALLMGAGDLLMSFLSVIVNICGVLILFFSTLLERFSSRKRLAIALTILSKLATLLIVVIPVFPLKMQLPLFVPLVVVAFTLQAQTTVVLNQWMIGFVNEKISGRYISLRQTITLSITVVLSVTGGYWMDWMRGNYLGFVLLFAFAALMGIFEIVMLLRTPAGEVVLPCTQRCKFRDVIKLPLKNRRFLFFVIYILVFYLLLTISDSYTMVFMMKYLDLPYQTVNILYMIISLPQVILLSIWGRISDKRGHDFVLRTSIWLFAGETLFMSFVSSQSWYWFIPAAFLVSSVANAGFVVAVFNRRYELMPIENRIVYDNFYTAAIGLGFILGPVVGGMMKSGLEAGAVFSKVMPFASIRLLYLISTGGILLLQFVYFFIQRKGKKKAIQQKGVAYITSDKGKNPV